MRGPVGNLVIGYYCICSVIRLAFFNVLETRRQQVEEGANKYYHGLPITSMAIVLPLVFMLQVFISDCVFVIVLYFQTQPKSITLIHKLPNLFLCILHNFGSF